MPFVLCPAKSLDHTTPVPDDVAVLAAAPRFMGRAAGPIGRLRSRAPPRAAALMAQSEPLARLDPARDAAWRPRHTARNSRPAVLAVDGLPATTVTAADLAMAQRHLAILCGRYGAPRSPHRPVLRRRAGCA